MELQQRVERLEKENRRLKLAGFGLFGLAIAGMAMQQVHAQSGAKGAVITKELVVQDDSGNQAAKIKAVDGGGSVSIFDDQQRVRAILASTKDGPGLAFFDSTGKTRAALEFRETKDNSAASLTFVDDKGKVQARLLVGKEGGMLLTSNAMGKPDGYFPRRASADQETETAPDLVEPENPTP